MSHLFLSDEWFLALDTLNNDAGDLPLSPALQTTILNLSLLDNAGNLAHALHIKHGKLIKTQDPNASATIIMDETTLRHIISTKSLDSALEAFMTGKIRIDGDMSAVLALQSAKPSTEQKALYKQILAMTKF